MNWYFNPIQLVEVSIDLKHNSSYQLPLRKMLDGLYVYVFIFIPPPGKERTISIFLDYILI